MASVPDHIKKNVRAVLLSKQGGVLVSDFTKDYKSLLNEQLRFKDLGFSTLKELIDAIPEVVRLEFDDGVMAYKMFGIGDPNTYMSLSAKRAEGRRGKNSPTKSPSAKPTMNGTCSRPDLEDKLIPNMRGHISVCYPREREKDDVSVDDIREKFSEFGEVAEVHMIPKFIFVRYNDKEAVIASLERYEKELRLRVAEEKVSQSSSRSQQNSNSNADPTESSDSMLVKKSPGGGMCFNCKQTGHFSRECPNKGAKDNSSKKKRTEREPYEVFLHNIACDSTEDDLNELLAEFNYKYVRRIAKDEKRIFAFVGFSNLTEAESMISKLNGYQWKGRSLNCRLSNDDQAKPSTQESKPVEEQTKFSWRSTVKESSSEIQASQSNSDTQNDWDDDPEDPGLKWNVTGSKVNTASPQQSMVNGKPLMAPSKFTNVSSVSNTQVPLDNQVRSAASPKKVSNHTQGMFNQFEQLTVQTNFQASSNSREVKSPMSNRSSRSPKKTLPCQNGMQSSVNYQDMPALQPIESQDPYAEMPPLELAVQEMPQLEPVGDDLVGLFIGNFPFGMSDRELLDLFQAYDPRHVQVFNRDYSNSSSKAMVYVNGMVNARRAIQDKNQSHYKGRRLLVDIDRRHPDYEANKAIYQRDNKVTQLGYNPMYRQQYMGAYQGSRFDTNSYGGYIPRQSPAPSGAVSPTPSNTSVSSSGSIKQRSFSSILQTYKIIMNTLQRRPQAIRPIKGSEVLGLITNVYDDKHLWVHLVQEESIQNLEYTMMMLQERETRIGPTKGLGRCAAKYDNEWFRAWIISDQREGFKVDVFYVDYGNMARINKGETSLTMPEAWELPVNLYPFRLAEGSEPVSKDMESKLVRMMVTRVGVDDTGYLNEATLNEVLS